MSVITNTGTDCEWEAFGLCVPVSAGSTLPGIC